MHEAKSIALEGCSVSSKSLLSVPDGDKEVAGRNGIEKYFPCPGVIGLPGANSLPIRPVMFEIVPPLLTFSLAP